jgi:DNA (cytosine-5)-methyltransferase 1
LSAYYNEHDPFCAEWLRRLIAAGLIAYGDVDERDIRDVQSTDLAGYRQCHFFAGIGIWSAALRAEGWSDEQEIWTGSCPCQPLSQAGQRKGHADKRHLWPAFHALIAECRPATVIGEQVSSADGREWLCAVRADLEAVGYAVGAVDTCAAGAGAPHIRQRLYWMGHANGEGWCEQNLLWGRRPSLGGSSATGELADTASKRKRPIYTGANTNSGEFVVGPESRSNCCNDGAVGWQWIACTDGKSRPSQPGIFPLVDAWLAGNRVAILRATGNALEIGTARQFIRAIGDLGPINPISL